MRRHREGGRRDCWGLRGLKEYNFARTFLRMEFVETRRYGIKYNAVVGGMNMLEMNSILPSFVALAVRVHAFSNVAMIYSRTDGELVSLVDPNIAQSKTNKDVTMRRMG